MKKFTATLAVVGTVFVSAARADYDYVRHQAMPQYQQLRADNADINDHSLRIGDTIDRFHDNTPILRGSQVPIILNEIDATEQHRKDSCVDRIDAFNNFDKHGREGQHRDNNCDCRVDRWGCDATSSHHTPGERHIVESKSSQAVTIVPVQAVITNTTQTITGEECSTSFGKRERNDVRRFEVEGNFKHSSYDVQQQCETQGDCFDQCGEQRDRYWDAVYDHDVECECNDISAQDFLGFDNSCACRHKVENPDEDIERRITHEVEKTISEILSEIVGKCISDSIANIIEWH